MNSSARETRAVTYEQLKSVIADRYPSMSRQFQQIARYLLESPRQVALATVAEVAKASGAQPSGIVRFAQSLDYVGFSDMQKVIRTLLLDDTDGSYRNRIASMQSEDEDLSAASALAHAVEAGAASLQVLGKTTSTEDLEAAADLLANAEQIYIVAERRAFPVAFYLSYAMSRLERRAHLLDGIGGMLARQASNIRKTDALIGVSFPPYSTAAAETVAEQSQRGVPTIAITDSPVSPLALEAKIAFPIQQQSESGFRSLVAPMCLAQVLVVCLGRRLVN